jgi:DNA-binding NtrC family response regulator
MSTALIVDDSMDVLLSLADICRDNDYSVETAQDLGRARDLLLKAMPEVAIFSDEVGGESSLDLLEQIDISRVMEIYLVSHHRSVDQASRAMRVGVSDYFGKPVNTARLAANLKALNHEIDCEADSPIAKDARGLMVGDSPPMQRLYRMIRKCAPSDVSVLVSGESGAGKELVALTIHSLSDRAACDIVTVNCSAIAKDLMESELFGHKKGSFTGASQDHKGFFERASGGTLFLDEISEMDVGLQSKLLRAIETGRIRPVGGERDIPIDVRVIAATNQEPHEAMQQDRLREDLFYRLAQFPIRVPPLRERSDDIDLLADHFLAAQNAETGIEKSLGDDVREAFRLYDWPGNVRELRNTVVQSHLLAGNVIEPADIPDEVRGGSAGTGAAPVGASISEVERRHILKTLEHYGGDKKKAAATLGISLKTLYNRLNEYEEQRRPD